MSSISSKASTGSARKIGTTRNRPCEARPISSSPRRFQFFTASIGFHHVHHLASRIPNYNLSQAHRDNPVFDNVAQITPWQGLMALRLKLYDEASGRLVSFKEAAAAHERQAAGAG